MSADGFVYFLAGGGFIKIGFSARPEKRWEWIRGVLPFPTEKIGVHPGSRAVEKALHVYFEHLHVRQQWFVDHPDIRSVAKGGLGSPILLTIRGWRGSWGTPKKMRAADERAAEIGELIRIGKNYSQIGAQLGLSRERVRVIAGEYGLGRSRSAIARRSSGAEA